MLGLVLMGTLWAGIGLFAFAVSGPLASWAANWHWTLREEQKPSFVAKKRRTIRTGAVCFMSLGTALVLLGLLTGLIKRPMGIGLPCSPVRVRPHSDDGAAPPCNRAQIGDPAATAARCVLRNVRLLWQDALTPDSDAITMTSWQGTAAVQLFIGR